MKIVLVRHAKVLLKSSDPMGSVAMSRWLEAYDSAPVDLSLPHDKTLNELINESNTVVCSSLPRTAESLKVLQKDPDLADPIFNEAEIQPLTLPWIRLSPRLWLTMIRLLSLAGVGRFGKSMQKSKEQAEIAADKLVALAVENETVLLLGHGGMNWLIGKALMRKGWLVEHKLEYKNWGYGVFLK